MAAAHVRQIERRRHTRLLTNANMRSAEVRQYCRLDGRRSAPDAGGQENSCISWRAYHRVLKLARIITGLAGVDSIRLAQLAGSIQYRPIRME